MIKIRQPIGKLRGNLRDLEILATKERIELYLIKKGNVTFMKLLIQRAYMPGTIPGMSSPLIL